MQVLNRLRNTETCSDNRANRVLPEIHFCTLSRVYEEQRKKFGIHFIHTQGCVSACDMDWADCVQFCLMAGRFVSGETLACTEEETCIAPNGAGSRLFAGRNLCGGTEDDSAFLP